MQQPSLPQAATLYVGDLKNEVAEKDLYETFSSFNLSLVRVVRDKISHRSLGYGYLNFKNVDDAMRALETMNYTPILGVPCRLAWNQKATRNVQANIFVSGLEDGITSKDLHETFSSFGNIVSCKIAYGKDGRSKGHGFVQFEREEDARRACESRGQILPGTKTPIDIVPFVPREKKNPEKKPQTNLYVRNLDPEFTEEDLRRIFGQFGDLVENGVVIQRDVERRSRGFGFANFKNIEAADRALAELNGKIVEPNKKPFEIFRFKTAAERAQEIKVFLAERAKRNVYVKGLPEDMNKDRLKDIFSTVGVVKSCVVWLDRETRTKSMGFGFCSFATEEDAKKAIQELHGHTLGNHKLFVCAYQTREERQRMMTMRGAFPPTMGMPMGAMPHFGFPQNYPRPAPQAGFGQMPQGAGAPIFPNATYQMYPFPSAQMPPYSMYPQQMMPGRRLPQPRLGRAMPPQGMMPGKPVQAQAPRAPAAGMAFLGEARNIPRTAPVQAPVVPAAPVAPAATTEAATLVAKIKLLPAEEAKQQIGEYLFPRIEAKHREEAGKITGMLLEMDLNELIMVIEAPTELALKVDEAFEVLQSAAQEEAKQ